ncbi:methylated-DNA--[protein]-cysteine S-methyltransferase [Mangrovibacterium lignilyticum]|uniref:methylated-DNA--[protein]-cysteine S-methyltransferase n=1 Tax=Mangrovibacterium lignilyticum TaxID=2668052 RepID=UPI001966FBE2|nr:methylated-DNA--[protein]-cysteine S-methyltransferase [Mangrovibacterium lignilyticum]
MKERFTYYSPIGPLCIETEEDLICSLLFCDKELMTENFNPKLQKLITEQLDDYFGGYLFEFDLPLKPSGTEFQKKVWSELQNIPYAHLTSYGELAMLLGDKNLVRAVGGANSKNPIAIIIPCHRVVGANKKLVGYAGGLWRKKWLLQHELTNKSDLSSLW